MGEPAQAHKEHINRYKMAHCIGVAEYMRENAAKYGLDKDLAYTVGLLHDIGYLKGRENHEHTGATILGQLGIMTDRVTSAVYHHGTSPQKLLGITYSDILEENPLLCLLYEADMSVGIDGRRIGFEERLKDFGKRYGSDGIEYQTAKETIDFVKETLERLEPEHSYTAEIYQIANVPENHGKRFWGTNELKKLKIRLTPSDYSFTYEFPIGKGDYCNISKFLETVFCKFQHDNPDCPDDYKGTSLSTSDIIVLSDGYKRDVYYIDDVGFTKFHEFPIDKGSAPQQNKSKSTHNRDTAERE